MRMACRQTLDFNAELSRMKMTTALSKESITICQFISAMFDYRFWAYRRLDIDEVRCSPRNHRLA